MKKLFIFLAAFLIALGEGVFLLHWLWLVFILGLLFLGQKEESWWGAFWVGFWRDLFWGKTLGESSFLFLLVAGGVFLLLKKWQGEGHFFQRSHE